MTLDQLVESLPLLTAISFAIGLVFVLIAWQFFHRSRRAPYWTLRRSAGQRGYRSLLVAFFFLTSALVFCGLTLAYPYLEDSASSQGNSTPSQGQVFLTSTSRLVDNLSQTVTTTPTQTNLPVPATTETLVALSPVSSPIETDPETSLATPTLPESTAIVTTITEAVTMASETFTPTPSETLAPSFTPSFTSTPSLTPSLTETPTATPTPSPTITPLPTETFTPSATPTPQPTAISFTTAIASTTPHPDAHLELVGLSNTSERRPPTTPYVFNPRLARLYFFVRFEHMQNGVLWRRELWKGDVLLYTRTDVWGNVAEGDAYFFIALPDGFPVGDYELRLYLGNEILSQSTIEFAVE